MVVHSAEKGQNPPFQNQTPLSVLIPTSPSKTHITEQLDGFTEADLGLLQHPRWSAL